jgi:hypothetical protein
MVDPTDMEEGARGMDLETILLNLSTHLEPSSLSDALTHDRYALALVYFVALSPFPVVCC